MPVSFQSADCKARRRVIKKTIDNANHTSSIHEHTVQSDEDCMQDSFPLFLFPDDTNEEMITQLESTGITKF